MGIISKIKSIFKKEKDTDSIQTTFNTDDLEELVEEGAVYNVQD